MLIRTEHPKDYEHVYTLIKEAFASAECSDGKEQDLVEDLRKGYAFIPELSIVAEIDKEIAGHILFTKLKIGGKEILALAPLAVLPKYQRTGIGTALIAEGHKRAQNLRYDYVVVLGSEKYYPRCGYVPAEKYHIQPPFDVPSQNFMAYKLRQDAPPVAGIVEYAREFNI